MVCASLEPVQTSKHQEYTFLWYFAPDQQPVPRMESWHRASQPVPRAARAAPWHYQSFAFTHENTLAPEVIYPDKWWVQASEPLHAKPRLNEYLYFWTDLRQPVPFADTWHPLIGQPFPIYRRLNEYPAFWIDPIQLVVPVDRWLPASNQPYFGKPRRPYLVPDYVTEWRQPIPRADSWHPEANQPYFPKLKKPHITPYYWTDFRQPMPNPDTWHPAIGQPYFAKLRNPQIISYFSIDPFLLTQAERSTPDKWHPLISQSRFDIVRAQFTYDWFFNDQFQGFQGIEEIITVDKWFVQASEPQRFKARLREYPYFEIDPFQLTQAERSTPDKWHPIANQPYLVKLRIPHLIPYFFTDLRQPIPSTDTWHPESNRPYLTAYRKPHLFANIVNVFDVREIITLDKWMQPQNLPVWDVTRHQFTYPYLTWDASQPIPRFEAWYPRIVDPVRLIPRAIEFPEFTGNFSIVFVGGRVFLQPLRVQSHQGEKADASEYQILRAVPDSFQYITVFADDHQRLSAEAEEHL